MNNIIQAKIATSRFEGGEICFLKDKVTCFRTGHDCNHTIVELNGTQHEIFMKLENFKNAMMED